MLTAFAMITPQLYMEGHLIVQASGKRMVSTRPSQPNSTTNMNIAFDLAFCHSTKVKVLITEHSSAYQNRPFHNLQCLGFRVENFPKSLSVLRAH